jgi:hypothetical protein
MMDESNAILTQQLAGRRIDYLFRKNKELHIVCTDGHTVVLQTDINGEIQFKKTDVKILMPGVSMFGDAGKF